MNIEKKDPVHFSNLLPTDELRQQLVIQRQSKTLEQSGKGWVVRKASR